MKVLTESQLIHVCGGDGTAAPPDEPALKVDSTHSVEGATNSFQLTSQTPLGKFISGNCSWGPLPTK